MLRKHEKGRQECLPHLQTRFRDGSRIQKSHCAAVEMIDSRINQLTVTIHELIRLSSKPAASSISPAGHRKEQSGRVQADSRSAFSTAAPCSAGLARFQTLVSIPLGPMMNVDRVIPWNRRP